MENDDDIPKANGGAGEAKAAAPSALPEGAAAASRIRVFSAMLRRRFTFASLLLFGALGACGSGPVDWSDGPPASLPPELAASSSGDAPATTPASSMCG